MDKDIESCMSKEKFEALKVLKSIYLSEYVEQVNAKQVETQDFAEYVASRLRRDFIAVDRLAIEEKRKGFRDDRLQPA
jgi:hypothetical protein